MGATNHNKGKHDERQKSIRRFARRFGRTHSRQRLRRGRPQFGLSRLRHRRSRGARVFRGGRVSFAARRFADAGATRIVFGALARGADAAVGGARNIGKNPRRRASDGCHAHRLLDAGRDRAGRRFFARARNRRAAVGIFPVRARILEPLFFARRKDRSANRRRANRGTTFAV